MVQSSASLVIIGAGIVGCCAAYHLTRMGWRDIVVLDKGPLPENDGSTSHAPGGVVVLSHNQTLTRMAKYSRDLYVNLPEIEHERNLANPLGIVELARSPERWADMARLHNEGQAFGVTSELLTPKETQDRFPFLNADLISGSLFVPDGTVISGSHVCGSLMREAEANGAATFHANTGVVDVEVVDGHVRSVKTDNPEMARIECDQVLLCTNIWAPVIGEKLGVALPLLAAEHQYVISTPVPGLVQFDPSNRDDEIVYPSVRDLDRTMYYRQHWNAWGVGSYWHRPRMVRPQDVARTALREFTADDFSEAWTLAREMVPGLRGSELSTAFNGMFAFSVDGMPIIGEATVKGFWVAVASWITHAGGVAKSAAEWMTHGETEWDLRQASIHRFQPYQTTRTYVDLVCANNYREVYDLVHPGQPITEPRNVRPSPFQPRLEALDVVYTPFAGLELPNWFESNGRLLEQYGHRVSRRDGWAALYWSRIQGVEHLATRENVALFDLTGLSILEVSGPGALLAVNHLCSSQMDRPVGQVIYTTLLTPMGGIKRDLTVVRLADDRFWLFVGEGTRYQDLAWVREHVPTGSSVYVSDITDRYTALGLWGPNARAVLEKATHNDVSNDAFPYFTSQWIEIGPVPVLALRISYAGELGWELHMPVDSALPIWDEIWEAGRAYDLVPGGMGAFDSLRLEKGYRLWGGDIHTEYNPYEAGLGWTVHLKKRDFLGRDACVQRAGEPLKKKLCCLTLDDANAAVLGYEPVFGNDGCIGYITSANYGYSVGKFIAYGYLPVAYADPGTPVEIGYFGERYKATVASESLYDPKMVRLKG